MHQMELDKIRTSWIVATVGPNRGSITNAARIHLNEHLSMVGGFAMNI